MELWKGIEVTFNDYFYLQGSVWDGVCRIGPTSRVMYVSKPSAFMTPTQSLIFDLLSQSSSKISSIPSIKDKFHSQQMFQKIVQSDLLIKLISILAHHLNKPSERANVSSPNETAACYHNAKRTHHRCSFFGCSNSHPRERDCCWCFCLSSSARLFVVCTLLHSAHSLRCPRGKRLSVSLSRRLGSLTEP